MTDQGPMKNQEFLDDFDDDVFIHHDADGMDGMNDHDGTLQSVLHSQQDGSNINNMQSNHHYIHHLVDMNQNLRFRQDLLHPMQQIQHTTHQTAYSDSGEADNHLKDIKEMKQHLHQRNIDEHKALQPNLDQEDDDNDVLDDEIESDLRVINYEVIHHADGHKITNEISAGSSSETVYAPSVVTPVAVAPEGVLHAAILPEPAKMTTTATSSDNIATGATSSTVTNPLILQQNLQNAATSQNATPNNSSIMTKMTAVNTPQQLPSSSSVNSANGHSQNAPITSNFLDTPVSANASQYYRTAPQTTTTSQFQQYPPISETRYSSAHQPVAVVAPPSQPIQQMQEQPVAPVHPPPPPVLVAQQQIQKQKGFKAANKKDTQQSNTPDPRSNSNSGSSHNLVRTDLAVNRSSIPNGITPPTLISTHPRSDPLHLSSNLKTEDTNDTSHAPIQMNVSSQETRRPIILMSNNHNNPLPHQPSQFQQQPHFQQPTPNHLMHSQVRVNPANPPPPQYPQSQQQQLFAQYQQQQQQQQQHAAAAALQQQLPHNHPSRLNQFQYYQQFQPIQAAVNQQNQYYSNFYADTQRQGAQIGQNPQHPSLQLPGVCQADMYEIMYPSHLPQPGFKYNMYTLQQQPPHQQGQLQLPQVKNGQPNNLQQQFASQQGLPFMQPQQQQQYAIHGLRNGQLQSNEIHPSLRGQQVYLKQQQQQQQLQQLQQTDFMIKEEQHGRDDQDDEEQADIGKLHGIKKLKEENDENDEDDDEDDEMEEEDDDEGDEQGGAIGKQTHVKKENEIKKGKKVKNETKNIPKNYAKAFLRYIIDKDCVEDMKKILRSINAGIEYDDIKREAKLFKKDMNAIKDVRKIWQDDTNPRTKAITKFMRIASHQFLRKEAISYIFSSNKIKNSKSHIIYRHVMGLAMADPEKFNNIKSLYKNAYAD